MAIIPKEKVKQALLRLFGNNMGSYPEAVIELMQASTDALTEAVRLLIEGIMMFTYGTVKLTTRMLADSARKGLVPMNILFPLNKRQSLYQDRTVHRTISMRHEEFIEQIHLRRPKIRCESVAVQVKQLLFYTRNSSRS